MKNREILNLANSYQGSGIGLGLGVGLGLGLSVVEHLQLVI